MPFSVCIPVPSCLPFSLSPVVAKSDDNCDCLLLSKDISIWRPSPESGQITTSKGPGCSQWARHSTLSPPSLRLSLSCLAMLIRARPPLEPACPTVLNKTLGRKQGGCFIFLLKRFMSLFGGMPLFSTAKNVSCLGI